MPKRGRPIGSLIRQNIIEILHRLGKGYGYEIHKIYKRIFPPCTREVVYYNLKRGVALGEFSVEEVKLEQGDYSWGNVVKKTYYKLGPNAKPSGDARVAAYFEQRKAQ
ncbi:hypothetical protein HY642_00775 [Candidatus Woesearchaeota archaeon]|nr:hypothetical protein [Candidatus Woesearchaeota archaeon]